jgi:exodeoxyribonuclease VIII
MHLQKSPKSFFYNLTAQPKFTEDFTLGSLVHTLVLEPTTHKDRYLVVPKFDMRTKNGKLAYEMALQEANGREIVSEALHKKAVDMASSAINDQEAKPFLADLDLVEPSIFFESPFTGIKYRVRPDAIMGQIGVDLKTAKSIGKNDFQSSAIRHGYYLQAGMVYEAMKAVDKPIKKFVNIAVEKTEPYPVSVFIYDETSIEYGIDLFYRLDAKLAEHKDSNHDVGGGLHVLTVPAYANYQLEDL